METLDGFSFSLGQTYQVIDHGKISNTFSWKKKYFSKKSFSLETGIAV